MGTTAVVHLSLRQAEVLRNIMSLLRTTPLHGYLDMDDHVKLHRVHAEGASAEQSIHVPLFCGVHARQGCLVDFAYEGRRARAEVVGLAIILGTAVHILGHVMHMREIAAGEVTR